MAPGNAPPGSAHEGKIRVYVRSRPVNAREEQSNTPTVLKFDAIKARELGLVAGNNINRRYTFDAVFSPQATQAMVYREVVDPILSEVLKGYNCTIFAYGQTGTGKTHTMEGNTTLNPGSGDLPVDAGMIPRSLHALFRSLDALDGDSDYTVKLSALELYNEELRDLFAIGEAPMAVKLFNDVNKQVIVQNAEELNVANAAEAMVKVQEAQAKRRVAATALNERSSRSHCIFTITVHIKECPEPGAELVKTGKLNLVDLAGSENVMRSGAEYGAAREAGMINKSLLYLARVINALVKRESHIPYRESKLTRLLQESLGGRAKTAIIATVSPVSSNVEDTISTLDYAHRAMAIQNKPVANQRLKKTELLADYGLEITRLKAELLAARNKDGVFLPKERFEELERDSEQLRQLRDRYALDMAVKDDELTAERSLHEATRVDLERAKDAYHVTKAQLVERTTAVQRLQGRARDDRLVLLAVSRREAALRGLLHDMSTTISAAQRDVDGLHDVLDSAHGLIDHNHTEVLRFRGDLIDELQVLSAKLKQFDDIQTNVGSMVQQQLEKFVGDVNAYQSLSAVRFNDFSARLCAQLDAVTDQLHMYADHPMTGDLRQQMEKFHKHVLDLSGTFHQQHESQSADLRASLTDFAAEHALWSQQTDADLASVFDSLSAHLASQTHRIDALQSLVAASHAASVSEMQDISAQSQAALAAGRERMADLEHRLVAQVTSLISGFAADSVQAWAGATDATVTAAGASQMRLASFASDAGSRLRAMSEDVSAHSTVTQSGSSRARAALETQRDRVVGVATASASQLVKMQDSEEMHVSTVSTAIAHHADLSTRLLDVADGERAAHVARAKDGVVHAHATTLAGVAGFKDAVSQHKESVSTEISLWKHQNLVDNSRQLVSGFSRDTAKLEEAVCTLATKRMREGGEIPRPAKRRHLTPRDDQIPPALNRVQILQAVNDADGDIKVTDAMEVESGSAASSVDIDEEGRVSPAADPTQLLSGAEPVDWIPPSPVPQTPRFIAKATAAPRPVTAPADENDPPATPSPTLSATSSPSRLETPTMLVRPQLNTLAFASVGSSGGGASGLVPPSSPAGLSRLPKPKFGGAVAPASALGKQLRVDSAGSSSTQLQ